MNRRNKEICQGKRKNQRKNNDNLRLPEVGKIPCYIRVCLHGSAWWLYVSILINIVMLIKNFSPDVSISASYGLNASDPLSVLFSIKNTGYLDIRNVGFGCTIYEGNTKLGDFSNVTTINGPEEPATGLAPAFKNWER